MDYITFDRFPQLLNALTETYTVYVPVKRNNKLSFCRYPCDEEIVVGEVRTFEPLKQFFLRAREQVARDFEPGVPPAPKPWAIVGAKACDLKSFKVQDHVYGNHGYVDPFYTSLRANNLIIAADCTSVLDTCFCTALGIRPYPEQNFDITMARVSGGYLLEAGSGRGAEILQKNKKLCAAASQSCMAERPAVRDRVTALVKKNVETYAVPDESSYPGMIEKNYEAPVWQDEARTCVECGACNTVCPTCHCFLLYDQKDPRHMERLRVWDSCLLKSFARVAGGHNPRPKLWMRLRNRFEKKFDFFPKVAGVYACTGCGRCISACPAKIDIRRVLRTLVAHV